MGRWSSRVVLVAGGAGFLGSHLCGRLLDQGDEVICIDSLCTARAANLGPLRRRPGFSFFRADIVDVLPPAIAARRDMDRIYNLACAAAPGRYQADPEHTMLTNVVGSNRLLRLAEQTGARYLLASTSEVYGDPEVHPQHEDYLGRINCTGRRACYNEGKRAAEALTSDFARMGRADVRIARIFNTYGPHMRWDDGRVVPNLICQALSGREITIFGDGRQSRSFCYVSDMIDGLVGLMEAEMPHPLPVNLGNPEEVTVLQLLAHVAAVTGFDCPVVHHPLPGDDPRRRRPDIERAKRLFGWSPAVPLSEGIAIACAWFEREIGRSAPAFLAPIEIAAE